MTALLGLARGATGQTLSVMYGGGDPLDARAPASGAIACALWSSLTAAVLLVALGQVLDLPPYVGWFGLAIPLVLTQDAVRFAAFSLHRPTVALASDAAWTLSQALLVVVWFSSTGAAGADVAVASWGAGAGIGLMVGVWMLRLTPTAWGLKRGREWVRNQRRPIARLVGIGLLVEVNRIIPSAIILLLLTSADLASVRGAQTLIAPAIMIAQGLSTALIPHAARSKRAGGSLTRLVLLSSVFCSAFATIAALAAWLLPPGAGEGLLGDTWAGAQRVVLLVGFGWAVQLCVVGPQIGLAALGELDSLVLSRAIGVVVLVLATAGGAATGSIELTLVATVVAAIPLAAVWWFTWLRRSRASLSTPTGPSPASSVRKFG